ncbi:TrbG/VirB9 family P-type conjugative transfer protein [Sphingomonas sp. SUN039]|uniref:TrbG/VirB9 family P-type conjugative transfer protein n=1 Tax=Sphingomonas sp. SUN039 TaxID=2937787 RepID=UPI0021649A9D|nr:TrbG/VirB9 family P-type conjugative transfer protein [Sphingomonas sp. SUN039]UVO52822.1 TrbG/VirB9 family P-type conjugative transfer protein [Sphingomonas sp. SUN039]
MGLSTPLAAQVPPPVSGDPRLLTVDYALDQVFRVQAATGYQVTIELNADERVESVGVGDAGAWQVTANRRGDHLFVKPLLGGVATNMTVVTNVRTYAFDLLPGNVGDMPYIYRFRYPGDGKVADSEVEQAPLAEGRYRLSGARAVRPSRISDDGRRTYIEWPGEAALPAVYAVNARGQEELVNGNMRDGLYVIDSVVPRLVFRIDAALARATRIGGNGLR